MVYGSVCSLMRHCSQTLSPLHKIDGRMRVLSQVWYQVQKIVKGDPRTEAGEEDLGAETDKGEDWVQSQSSDIDNLRSEVRMSRC